MASRISSNDSYWGKWYSYTDLVHLLVTSQGNIAKENKDNQKLAFLKIIKYYERASFLGII